MDTSQTLSSTPDYTMGYSEEYLTFLSIYRVEELAGYLLERLQPGVRIIDLGCGPGFMSVGLAEAVAPGVLYGVDVEPSQIEMARQIARDGQVGNVVFDLADLVDLPYEDGFFDVAHCNDVLAYVPDTAAVLAEAKRVLKPGGLLGCREMIVDSSFVHPDLGIMNRGWEVFADLLTADDGHPQIGKDLKMLLLQSGFTDVRASLSWETYSEPEQVDHFYTLVKEWFLSLDVTEGAKLYGAATDNLFEVIGEAIGKWRGDPAALAAVAFGEALGCAPLS